MSFIDRHLRRNVPLGDADMRKLAPSIFAEAGAATTSARYAHIPTIRVIDALRAEGFQPFSAREARSRDEARVGYAKHLVRFRRPDDPGQPKRLGQVYPEVVMVNAHDGSSAYQLSAGLFRLVCLNGMVAADEHFGSVHVPHRGDIIEQVVEGTYRVIAQSSRALEAAERWDGVRLSRDEQMILAEAAHEVRWPRGADEPSPTLVKPEQLLMPRRRDDVADSLWHTFNRVQENTIQGGITTIGRDAANRRIRRTTRAVKGIDADIGINRALWKLAERMAELKGAA